MKPGIYTTLSNAEYHGGPGISKSGLDLIARSPLHLRFARDAANDHAPTPAQMIGTAFHCLLLEPAVFVQTYTLALRPQDVPEAIVERDQLVAMVAELNKGRLQKLPTSGSKAEQVDRILAAQEDDTTGAFSYRADDLATMTGADLKGIIDGLNKSRPGLLKETGTMHELAAILRDNGKPLALWKDLQDTWMQNNTERIVLTPEQWEQLHGMRDSVMAHPAASALLQHVNNVVVDVKTTEDASPEGFGKSIVNYRYHVQHPMYLDGLHEAIRQGGVTKLPSGVAELSAYWVDEATGELCRCRPDFWRGRPDNFAFLAVEKKAPYAVGVYVLPSEVVDIGRAQYQADLARYAECQKTGVWPGYGDKVQTIGIPGWFIHKNADLIGAA